MGKGSSLLDDQGMPFLETVFLKRTEGNEGLSQGENVPGRGHCRTPGSQGIAIYLVNTISVIPVTSRP